GGAGRFRGGLGLEKIFEATTTDVTVSHRGERFASSPWPLEGGAPGARAHAHIVRADGTGYGDPLDRDPAAVLADRLDGKITANAVTDEYGVVLTPDGAGVDEEKTKESRAARRRAQG